MGGCRKCMILTTAVIVILMAYLLNTPVPDGMTSPWKLRFAMIPIRFMVGFVSPALQYFYGYGGTCRLVQHLIPPKEDDGSVEVQYAMFDEIPVRISRSAGGATSEAAVIWLHGGGWIFGSVEMSEPTDWLAKELGLTVVAVSYRKAPDHLFPVAYQDCLRASAHFLKHAHEYGVDPNRIAIMGESAGGTLSTAVAMGLRDQKFQPALKLQVLLAPVLQPIDFQLPSYQEDRDVILFRQGMIEFWLTYALGDADSEMIADLMNNNHTTSAIKQRYASSYLNHDILPQESFGGKYKKPDITINNPHVWSKIEKIFLDPYFAPGIAEDVRNLPRMFIQTAETDVLRDEAILYAKRLKDNGVEVTHKHYTWAFHGMFSANTFEQTATIRNDVKEFLVRNL